MFVNSTKVKKNMHVVLGSNDYFFYHWINEQIGCGKINAHVIGDLLRPQAEKFYNEYAKLEEISNLPAFEPVYSVLGGRIFYIIKFLHQWKSGLIDAKSYPKGTFTNWHPYMYAQSNIMNTIMTNKGTIIPSSPFDPTEWTTETATYIYKEIARKGFLLLNDLKQNQRTEALSLLKHNRISYRPQVAIVPDIEGQPNTEVLVPRSPLQRSILNDLIAKKII